MKKIKMFDCTIHEGGYRNHWKFCENEMQLQGLIGELTLIGSDVIDIGIIGNPKYTNGSSSYEKLSQVPVKYLSSKKEYAITIIDYENFNREDLTKISKVNYLRIVVGINNSLEKLNLLCNKAKKKGYKVIISVEIKPEDEISTICDFVRQVKNYDVLIIDDTFNACEEKIIKCFDRMEHMLEKNITLGFRGRNSRYQAQGIIECLISLMGERDFVIEASIFGISRNVGLVELEMVAAWLNDRYEREYNLTRIEKVTDIILKSVKYNAMWKVDRLSPTICDNAIDYSYREIVNTTSITSEELAHILNHIPYEKRDDIDLKLCFQNLENYRDFFYKTALYKFL